MYVDAVSAALIFAILDSVYIYVINHKPSIYNVYYYYFRMYEH